MFPEDLVFDAYEQFPSGVSWKSDNFIFLINEKHTF